MAHRACQTATSRILSRRRSHAPAQTFAASRSGLGSAQRAATAARHGGDGRYWPLLARVRQSDGDLRYVAAAGSDSVTIHRLGDAGAASHDDRATLQRGGLFRRDTALSKVLAFSARTHSALRRWRRSSNKTSRSFARSTRSSSRRRCISLSARFARAARRSTAKC